VTKQPGEFKNKNCIFAYKERIYLFMNSKIQILQKLELDYYTKYGDKVVFNNFQPISGGSINRAAKVSGSKSTFFLKWNHEEISKDMFNKEILGLQF